MLLIGSAGTETSAYNLSGGTLSAASGDLQIGSNGSGQFTQSGGTASFLGVELLPAAGQTAALTLSGGTLVIANIGIYGALPGDTVTFGGGTLLVSAIAIDWLPTSLTSGTNTTINVVGTSLFTMPLGITGGGALTKSGSGTLSLAGANSYSAGTTVTAGILNAPKINSMGTGPVIQAGGTLDIVSNTSGKSLPVMVSGFNQDVIWGSTEARGPRRRNHD